MKNMTVTKTKDIDNGRSLFEYVCRLSTDMIESVTCESAMIRKGDLDKILSIFTQV